MKRDSSRPAADVSPMSLPSATHSELQDLVHELRVHEIELEAQNEELRRTQRALELSQARYFELYDLAPVGYLTVDSVGTILEANLMACTLIGVERSLLVGAKITRFIFLDDQDLYERHRRSLHDGGRAYTCELRLRARDGEPKWVRFQAAPVNDLATPDYIGMTPPIAPEPTGLPRTCRLILSDISDARRAEARLAQTDRVASVGMIASGIAHEINNPLSYVLLNIDTLVRELPEVHAAARAAIDALLAVPQTVSVKAAIALARVVSVGRFGDVRKGRARWPRTDPRNFLGPRCIFARRAG